MNDFDKYQENTERTAKYKYSKGRSVRTQDLVYPVLALNGEAGEVAEKLKRLVRENQKIVSEQERQAMALELGDVLWYVAQSARRLKFKLSDIVRMNVEKLESRHKRGKIIGEGDNR